MEEVEVLQKTDDSKDDKSDKNGTVDAYILVLFDGTNNNMYNIQSYRKLQGSMPEEELEQMFKKLGSCKQEFTNVARLSQICKTSTSSSLWASSVYVDGIGTSTGGDSKFPGQALGTGGLGVEAKVQKGCELVVQCLNDMFEKSGGKPCDVTLHLGAVGFSRGAAAARRFISCIDKNQGEITWYKVCLKKHLDKVNSNITLNDDIDVPIVGLFDTVSSFGLLRTLTSSIPGLKKQVLKILADNVKGLSLNKLDKATKVFQLCAADEYRLHFGLTKVNGDANNYIIPGCHSDVGGGTNDGLPDNLVEKTEKKGDVMLKIYNGNKTEAELLNEGWFTLQNKNNKVRIVSNKYSFIPYSYMLKLLQDNLSQVKSKLFDDSTRQKSKYGKEAWESDKDLVDKDKKVLGEFLGMVMGNKKFYSFPKISEYKESNTDSLKYLRNRFIHLSAEFSAVNCASPDNERLII